MNTYRHIVYLILDEIKAISDDSTFNEQHVMFLLDKYRAFILKQRYSDVKKEIPDSNYQKICLGLREVNAIDGCPCTGGTYLKSTSRLPDLLPIGSIKVYPTDYFQGDNIAFINKDRMKFVGYNRWLKNIIYCALDSDNFLTFKSNNPQHKYLEKVCITGIFENPEEIFDLKSSEENPNTPCDMLDAKFPIEEALIIPIIEMVVKELLGASYRPADGTNNANDDLSDLVNFISRNIKSRLQKQINGDE